MTWGRNVVALALVVGLLPAVAGAQDLPPVPVTVEFAGTGSFSATNSPGTESQTGATVALDWDTTYQATIASDGTMTPAGPGTLVKGPGTFTFSDPSYSVSCSGNAPVSAFANPPNLDVSALQLTAQSVTLLDSDGSSGGYSACQGTAPGSDLPFDGSGEAASLVGTIDPYLPDVLSARVTLPAQLTGPVTLPASSGDAPAQLPGSCADQFGDDSCTMTLSWSGTVTVTPACGTITFSDGGALPLGSIVQVGQTLSTGPGQRLELTGIDGSVVRVGPQSQVVCEGGDFTAAPRKLTMKLILGDIWAKVSDALGADQSTVQTDRAVTGVRGSEYTLSVHGGTEVAHVVEGTGFVQVPGRPEFDYPAGLSAVIGKSSVALSTQWPAAAHGLVPAEDAPPALAKLRLKGGRLRFTLDRAAALRIQLLRGSRVLKTSTAKGRKGANSIRAYRKAPKRGRYTLRLTATANTRSTSAQVAFRR